MKPQGPIRVGADVGGTFTDVVLADAGGNVWTAKVPSTPPDFETAVLNGISQLLDDTAASGTEVAEVVHGTTVATNAILERRGALTALITTRGFRDVLELRRIRAPQMYDLFFQKPPELVERRLRFELGERLTARGEVLAEADPNDLDRIARRLKEEKVESVAVCLLHAYAWPQHENLVGESLRQHLPQVPVSLSSEVLRERKEYERTATTVVNAYVRPVMRGYLAAMRSGMEALDIRSPLLIMQSAGGLTPEEEAARRPVYMLESGPAAGVLASQATARHLGLENVITLDMGGTTAKASLIEEGRVRYSPEYEVGASLSAGNRLVGGGGELIRAPSIDLAEVGLRRGQHCLSGRSRRGPGGSAQRRGRPRTRLLFPRRGGTDRDRRQRGVWGTSVRADWPTGTSPSTRRPPQAPFRTGSPPLWEWICCKRPKASTGLPTPGPCGPCAPSPPSGAGTRESSC